MLGLAGLAFVSGLATATALVLLIQVALRITDSGETGAGVLGIDLAHHGLGALFSAAVVAATTVLLADLLAARQNARIISTVQLRLRRALFDAYGGADWVTQTADPPGHLQDVMATNVSRALNLTTAVTSGLVAVLTLATMVGSAVLLSPVATLLLLTSLSTLVAVLTPLARKIRDTAERMRTANLDHAVQLAEVTAVPTEIRTFGVAAAVQARHTESATRVANRHAALTRLEKAVPALQRNLALITVLLVLAAVHNAGLAGIGELGTVVVLLGRSLTYAHAIQQTVNKFAAAGPFVLALDDEIERYRGCVDTGTRRATDRSTIDISGPADPLGLAISLERVSYRHPSADKPALDDVSFTVAPGEHVAVVGPSGSGKTTLAEVLLRLRAPDTGHYRVGGIDAPVIPGTTWTDAVAYVPQRPALITGTVADNVRFFRSGITDAQVETALVAAELLDDIVALPDGVDTRLGSSTRSLSGGQLQRLAIARALAGRPQLIVLDEPTSALDPRTESAIGATLRSLAGTLTLVVIAHRAATIDGCDRLIVLEHGRVTADGSPSALEAAGGFWQRAFAISGPSS